MCLKGSGAISIFIFTGAQVRPGPMDILYEKTVAGKWTTVFLSLITGTGGWHETVRQDWPIT